LYVPHEVHKLVSHALSQPETMGRINTLAYTWLLGGLVV